MYEPQQRERHWRWEAENRYYSICKVSFLFGLIQHAAMAILFSVLDLPVLSYYNILSVFVFVLASLLNESRQFYIALTIAYVEVVVHQVLATLFLGWDTGFHLYVLFCIMLPLLTSRGHNLWKGFIAGSSAIVYIILLTLYRNAEPLYELSSAFIDGFMIVNSLSFIAILVIIAYVFNGTVLDFEEKLEREFTYAQSLLLNILPEPIARRLGASREHISDRFDEATVLFADIVGFTAFAESISSERLVELLDHLFARFDSLCDSYECEKIKTIGDAYMVAAGVPESDNRHAEKIILLSQAMLNAVDEFNLSEQQSLQVRIGVHSGPLVAGVIGRRKFSYDLWGDTVNTAARMESSGLPGEVQVTRQTVQQCGDIFIFESRGIVTVKGKGSVETFLLSRGE